MGLQHQVLGTETASIGPDVPIGQREVGLILFIPIRGSIGHQLESGCKGVIQGMEGIQIDLLHIGLQLRFQILLLELCLQGDIHPDQRIQRPKRGLKHLLLQVQLHRESRQLVVTILEKRYRQLADRLCGGSHRVEAFAVCVKGCRKQPKGIVGHEMVQLQTINGQCQLIRIR